MSEVWRICPRHRVRYRLGSRCGQCPAKRGNDTAARKAQAEFRAALIAISDGQCSYTHSDGNRCTATENLEAGHADRYSVDGNFTGGAMLCPTHHRLWDRSHHG